MVKKHPRIFWTKKEWEDWQAAVELEAAPRPDGSFSEIANAAMQHMTRPRPISQEMVTKAGALIRAFRAAQSTPKMSAPEVTEDFVELEPLEPALLEPTHWTEELAGNLSRLLIETIVQTAESPAVRKAVRSLIKVATDREFQPEIDSTVVWERPTIGPRLPRVLVAGFVKHGPIRDLIDRFSAKLDLRFWRSDDSLSQLRRDLQSAEHVVFMTGSTSHAAEQTIAASGKQYTRIPSASFSMATRELQRLVNLKEKR